MFAQIDPFRWLAASDADLSDAARDEPPAFLRLGARLVLRHLIELVGLELPGTDSASDLDSHSARTRTGDSLLTQAFAFALPLPPALPLTMTSSCFA